MPELPDVEIFKKVADRALHHEISGVKIHDDDFTGTSQNKLTRGLKGKKFERSRRHGKYLFMDTGNEEILVLHFGMTGTLKYEASGEDQPEYTKCSIRFDNNRSLHYISKRKLGKFELTSDLGSFLEEQELGPDAMEMEKEEFSGSIKNSRAMIKSRLTDQSVIAGVGNVYSDEILFQAGIHPKTPCRELSEEEVDGLFRQMKKVLKKAIEKEADVSSLPDSYLLSSREKGASCPSCKGKIKKIKVTGRATYYCPSCQKKK